MPRARKPPPTHGPRKTPLDDQALFDDITSLDMLQRGWTRVWRNGGAAGGDRVSVERFAFNVMARLARLRSEVRRGAYRPGPVREVMIPKRSGRGLRRLSIPCVADRVLQTAAAMVLTPLFDEEFEPASFGYRPGRGVRQAVAQVARARREGFTWVVDADIEDYFDSIPHDGLMARWAESVGPGPLTELVWTWLTHAAPEGRGVAQGSPISPLLANLYLDRLDEALHGRDMRLVRFADDFVVLCRGEQDAQAVLKRVEQVLAGLGLRLNREKTRIVDFERGFRFLGHMFVRSLALKVAREEEPPENAAERLLREIAERDKAEEEAALMERLRIERAEARGYSPGFRVMHLHGADRRLNIRNQAFCVEEARQNEHGETVWREIIAVPHQDIDRIDIGPEAGVTEEALRHLPATDTLAALVNGHGETLAWITQPLAPKAARHLAQARLALDEAARLDLARRLVMGRLRNQRTVLRRLLAGRKDKPGVVLDAIATLNRLIGRSTYGYVKHAASVEQLMGYEGEAAKAWWRAIGALAHADFRFRVRRETSPAGICLDFLSWLLHRDISVAVMRAGLHPGFGALHSVSDTRDACVYDLMEEFRAHFVGSLFVYATTRRIVRPEMFERRHGKARMKPEGARALIRAYEQRAEMRHKAANGKRVRWRQLMVWQAMALAAHVEGRGEYAPHAL